MTRLTPFHVVPIIHLARPRGGMGCFVGSFWCFRFGCPGQSISVLSFALALGRWLFHFFRNCNCLYVSAGHSLLRNFVADSFDHLTQKGIHDFWVFLVAHFLWDFFFVDVLLIVLVVNTILIFIVVEMMPLVCLVDGEFVNKLERVNQLPQDCVDIDLRHGHVI